MYLNPTVLQHGGEIRPTHTGHLSILHITDTHLLDNPDENFHNFDTRSYLESVLEDSLARYPDTDFLLFTGDISQTGSETSYELFDSLIRPYDLPVYSVPGNHDTPEVLQRFIPNSPANSINIIDLGPFSLILISSWVQDQHHGMVSQHCLQQLHGYLSSHRDQFHIIALHHPPVLTNSKWLDQRGLLNRNEFLSVLGQHQGNILVLSGHVHQEIDYMSEGLRMLATPSTCYQFKANSDNMCRLDRPQPAYRYLGLSADGKLDTQVHYLDVPL